MSNKVATIKTRGATVAFFLFLLPFSSLFLFSFPFPSLLWFWNFLGLRNLPFDPFSLKWLQILLGWFSKNQLDIFLWLYEIRNIEVEFTSLKPRLLNLAGSLWNFQVFATSKEIEIIKICKIAKEGSKCVNDLLRATLHRDRVRLRKCGTRSEKSIPWYFVQR